jgi:polysaccharide biosynthesis protein PslG
MKAKYDAHGKGESVHVLGRRSRYRSRSLALLACLLTLIPIAARAVEPAVQPSGGQSANPYLFGIAAHAWWLDPKVYGNQLFPTLDDLKVTTVRLSIDWRRFESTPGTYDWSLYDRVLGALATRHIVIVADFNTIPSWASTDVEGCADSAREISACELRNDMYPAFERAVHAAVSRYSWIDHWEFWNEPEIWDHFGGTNYLLDLRLFYDIAHRINPEISVAACTLAGPEFMEWIYNVSDAWYGKGYQPWDAIAYHPYNLDVVPGADGQPLPIRYDRILDLHRIMMEQSGPEMKMWITEYGWINKEKRHGHDLVESLDWMKQQPYIEFAHLHMLHDWSEVDPNGSYGLMAIVPDSSGARRLTPQTRFTPKQGYYNVFQRYVHDNLPATWSRNGPDVPRTGQNFSARVLSLLRWIGVR